MPTYQSPIRHHQRKPSRTHHVKESLNARSRYDSDDDSGAAYHRINQYIIKQEIGRGAFGAVHLAVDQFGTEFAVKEFSKSRMRKRAQSNLLRRPGQKRHPGHLAAGTGFNSPMHRTYSEQQASGTQSKDNALDLIKEEIAIMKKLNHNNLVSLDEVLDDPGEDSLYMVLELCKKGVVMKVGLEDTADPYDEEQCRCWFRDMMLGIEYLHAQGIIHRDIKPDNCLVTEDGVLKISDFGVSEMFEKQSEMATAKSAGSPAFMPPELCVPKHGQIAGKPADIWSMGVTLYCLRYGRIPFEKSGVLELYEAIRSEDFPFHDEPNQHFADLMHRILEKDPERRITMEELREHPWVTKNGEDPLLSAKENCEDLIDAPTAAEKDNAITGNMKHLVAVMRAVKQFKKMLYQKRPQPMESILGRTSRIVAPPDTLAPGVSHLRDARSQDADDRKPLERVLTAEGVHHDLDVSSDLEVEPKTVSSDHMSQKHRKVTGSGDTSRRPLPFEPASFDHSTKRSHTFPLDHDEHTRGHAHDPLLDMLFLNIGAGIPTSPEDPAASQILSESPGAAEENVYEAAYQREMQRILAERGRSATMYLTRRVEANKEIREHENVIGHSQSGSGETGGSGFAALVKKAKAKVDAKGSPDEADDDGKEGGLAGLVQKAKENARDDHSAIEDAVKESGGGGMAGA